MTCEFKLTILSGSDKLRDELFPVGIYGSPTSVLSFIQAQSAHRVTSVTELFVTNTLLIEEVSVCLGGL